MPIFVRLWTIGISQAYSLFFACGQTKIFSDVTLLKYGQIYPPQPYIESETVSRFLPLALLELRTLRPLASAILARNPCLLAFFLLDGWNVLFMSHSLLSFYSETRNIYLSKNKVNFFSCDCYGAWIYLTCQIIIKVNRWLWLQFNIYLDYQTVLFLYFYNIKGKARYEYE